MAKNAARVPCSKGALIGLLLTVTLSASGLRAEPTSPEMGLTNPVSHPVYPETPRHDVTDVLHGVELHDPYRWLENATDAAVVSWIKAEDTLGRETLHALPYRTELQARFKQLFYLDSINPPTRRGHRYFYYRGHATKEMGTMCWKEGKDGAEHVLLDPNTWSKDGSLSLGGVQVNYQGTEAAYKVRQNNADESIMYVLDVKSGVKSTVDVIPGAKYAGASWTPDGKGFYYTYLPTDPTVAVADRPGLAEVRFHHLGQDPRQDELIYPHLGDPTSFLGCGLSRDGHWLFVDISHGWSSSDIYYRDMRSADTTFKPLVVGRKHHYSVEAYHDQFYLQTDEDAPNNRLYRVEPSHIDRPDWHEIVPERHDAELQSFGVVGGRLAISYLKNAVPYVEVHDLDGRPVRAIKGPSLGSLVGLFGEPDDDDAYYSFQTFTTPTRIYETSVSTGASHLWTEVKAPVNPKPYITEQVFFSSKDGTPLTMFVVRRRDFKFDGTAPALMTGYGGFASSTTPYFASSAYPFLEHGGIFIDTVLRGGAEYGEKWHQDGMLLKKQNVFDDFSAAAEYLIAHHYTSPDHLAIAGASNGGLLVGAVMTQHPDLFRAVVCGVPLLDMIRYHLFGSGKTWVSEYGSADDETQFKALLAYSPYQHVQDGVRYPAVLMLSADADDRVDPMHARKFTAALQHASTGGPVLMRVEQHSGHGGASQTHSFVERYADEYAFLFWQLGIHP